MSKLFTDLNYNIAVVISFQAFWKRQLKTARSAPLFATFASRPIRGSKKRPERPSRRTRSSWKVWRLRGVFAKFPLSPSLKKWT